MRGVYRKPSKALLAYRKTRRLGKHADILGAARREFIEKGFPAAVVSTIAREANASTATVYKYFGSKEDLFRAALVSTCHQVEEFSVPHDASLDALDAIQAYVAAYFDLCDEIGGAALLRMLAAEALYAPRITSRLDKALTVAGESGLADRIEELMRAGALPPLEAGKAAGQIICLVRGHLIWPGILNARFVRPKRAARIIGEAIRTSIPSLNK